MKPRFKDTRVIVHVPTIAQATAVSVVGAAPTAVQEVHHPFVTTVTSLMRRWWITGNDYADDFCSKADIKYRSKKARLVPTAVIIRFDEVCTYRCFLK